MYNRILNIMMIKNIHNRILNMMVISTIFIIILSPNIILMVLEPQQCADFTLTSSEHLTNHPTFDLIRNAVIDMLTQ